MDTKVSPRLCVVCGARIQHPSPSHTTCSKVCTLAKNAKITRERAARLVGVKSAGNK